MAKPEIPTSGLQHAWSSAAENRMLREDRESAWVGWLVFAGVMMIVLGSFNAVQGFVALLNGSWLADSAALPVRLDYTTWGWTWLIFGSIVAAAGFGVFAARTWARVVGVVFAVLNAIAQLLWIPAYPFWGLAVIAVDLIVIWALTAHGREIAR